MEWDVRGSAAVWVNVSQEQLCSRNTEVRFISTGQVTQPQSERCAGSQTVR